MENVWSFNTFWMETGSPNSFLAALVSCRVSSDVEPPAPQVKSVKSGPKAFQIQKGESSHTELRNKWKWLRHIKRLILYRVTGKTKEHVDTLKSEGYFSARKTKNITAITLELLKFSKLPTFIFTIRLRKFSTPSAVFGGKYSKENQPARCLVVLPVESKNKYFAVQVCQVANRHVTYNSHNLNNQYQPFIRENLVGALPRGQRSCGRRRTPWFRIGRRKRESGEGVGRFWAERLQG